MVKIFLNFFFSLTAKKQTRFFFILLFFNFFKKFFFFCKKKRKTLVRGVKGPKKSFNTLWVKSHVLVLCAEQAFFYTPNLLTFFFQNYLNVLKATVSARTNLILSNNFLFYFKARTTFLYFEECSLIDSLSFHRQARSTSLRTFRYYFLKTFFFKFNFF